VWTLTLYIRIAYAYAVGTTNSSSDIYELAINLSWETNGNEFVYIDTYKCVLIRPF